MKNGCFLFLLLLCCACGSSRYWYAGTVTYADLRQELPFEYIFNELFVTVQLDGNDYRFIVDTGAPTVIDQRVQEIHRFEVNKVANVNDSQGNSKKQDYVALPLLTCGGLTAVSTNAIVSDFSAFTCMNIDGILGANVMRQYDWEIDYEDEVFRLYTPEESATRAADFPIAFPFVPKSTGTPSVAVTIGDEVIRPVTFDTGSTGTITLPSRRVADPATYLDEMKFYGLGTRGLFGRHLDTARYVLTHRLLLGNTPIDTTRIYLPNSRKALMGNEFLDDYRVLVRWSTQTIHLLPVAEVSDQLPTRLHAFSWENDTLRYSRGTLHDPLVDWPVNSVVTALGNRSVLPISEQDYCALSLDSLLLISVRLPNGQERRRAFDKQEITFGGIREDAKE